MDAPPRPGYRAMHLDELEAVPWKGGRLTWRPVRGQLGIGAFGAAAFTATHGGDEVVEPHAESPEGRGQQELYFVARGRATFTVAGDEIDAPAGTFVFVEDPAVRRAAVAAEPDTAVLVFGRGVRRRRRGPALAGAGHRARVRAGRPRRGRTRSWRACSTRPPDRAQAIGPRRLGPAGARGSPPATSSKRPATRPASAGHA